MVPNTCGNALACHQRCSATENVSHKGSVGGYPFHIAPPVVGNAGVGVGVCLQRLPGHEARSQPQVTMRRAILARSSKPGSGEAASTLHHCVKAARKAPAMVESESAASMLPRVEKCLDPGLVDRSHACAAQHAHVSVVKCCIDPWPGFHAILLPVCPTTAMMEAAP